jgi:subfamily B ATP-binding cassette protein MsbA
MLSDLRHLLSSVRPYRAQFALALVSLLLASLLALVPPYAMLLIVDMALIPRDPGRLNHLIILLITTLALQALLAFARTYLLSYVGERIAADLRLRLYSHLIRLPLSFFADRRAGELASRLTSDVGVIQTVTTGTLAELIRQVLVLVGGVITITVMNPRLSLIMLSVFPLVTFLTARYGRYLKRLSMQLQDCIAEASSQVYETFSNIRIVQSFVREEYERDGYRRKTAKVLQFARWRAAANGGFAGFNTLLIYGALAFVFWLGSSMITAGTLTPGELTAFFLYTFYIGDAVTVIFTAYGQLQNALGSARRIFELLEIETDITELDAPETLGRVRGDVQFINVHFTYPGRQGVEVLTGVSIRLEPGKIMAVVGPSGAGKSTMAALIPRFYDVTSGTILIDGKEIKSLKLRELRESIAIVHQEVILFGGTIRENIAYGKLDACDAEIDAAARAANAHSFIEDLPDGYHTVVGDGGVKLSAGQRQRIAIARAILKNPAILILDEATSALDSESERSVQEALDKLMQGRSTFVIAHRLSTIRRADTIIVLDHGKIVETGTHERLLSNNGLYTYLYNIQVQRQSCASGAAFSDRR